MNIYLYAIIALIIMGLVASYISFLVGKKSSKQIIQSFIDSQSSIILLYRGNSISMINQAGLDFFNYNSLKSLLARYADISELFIAEDGCIDKYTYGINWVKMAFADKKNKKNIVKVKMLSSEDNLNHYFHIKISKMINSSEYILSFSDITNIELEKSKILKKSELDPLTQIYNRVKLNEMFMHIFFASKKYNQTLTMILFDIDHFKKINDNYGHNVGDSVLQELAGLIRGLLREGDVFARWGGEEFVILLQDTSLQKSSFLADRLRKEIEKYPFNEVKKVTCSFGVTEFYQGDTKSSFFERVDEALYEAKESGRNRVVTK